jgi:hypothetical protein
MRYYLIIYRSDCYNAILFNQIATKRYYLIIYRSYCYNAILFDQIATKRYYSIIYRSYCYNAILFDQSQMYVGPIARVCAVNSINILSWRFQYRMNIIFYQSAGDMSNNVQVSSLSLVLLDDKPESVDDNSPKTL